MDLDKQRPGVEGLELDGDGKKKGGEGEKIYKNTEVTQKSQSELETQECEEIMLVEEDTSVFSSQVSPEEQEKRDDSNGGIVEGEIQSMDTQVKERPITPAVMMGKRTRQQGVTPVHTRAEKTKVKQMKVDEAPGGTGGLAGGHRLSDEANYKMVKEAA